LSRIRKISVVGLGKLGLCLAAVLAESGFKVVGVDVDEAKVKQIARGRSPIYEPGLGRLMRAGRHSLSATTKHEDAIRRSEATFVVVPTPSSKSGEFSLGRVRTAMQRIGRVLRTKPGYHLVVLSSTVMPGSMDGSVRRTLEKASDKKAGRDFGLCYNPEFIALGDVVKGLRNPDFVLVGESDARAGDLLADIQRRVCANGAPIERMSFWNAEVAKMAVNSFVTMKMSFANTLAEICERIPGGDVDDITRAIGRDRRIGSAYLRGGMGYGGPCFPRDNRAFARFAKKVGVKAELALATDSTNDRQLQRMMKLVEDRASPKTARIGVLGVTYKPNTNVIEASQPLLLAQGLAARGYKVSVYDPSISQKDPEGPYNVTMERDAESCVEKSDVCVIATPWRGFESIDKSRLSKKIVLDCWRILNGNRPDDSSKYLALGRQMINKNPLSA